MKTNVVFALFLSVTFLFTSCSPENIKPSSTVTTVTHNITSFYGIDVSHAFEVEVTFSDTEENIEIEANENLHDEMIVEKVGNQLVIRFANNTSIKGNATLKAIITTKDATLFEGSGATHFKFQNTLNSNEVKVSLSGASQLEGTLEVSNLDIELSGASMVDLEGSTIDYKIDASGASTIENYNFSTDFLDVKLSGASNLYTTVNQSLDVNASGASMVYYRGDGLQDDIKLTGASQVKKTE